ncbi:hypothetical protein AB2C39_33510, partial [Pseudomonas aeruginosa]
MNLYLSGPRRWAGFLRALTVLLGTLLAGCQSPREALQQLANAHGRQLEILPGQPFPLPDVPPTGCADSDPGWVAWRWPRHG